MILQTDRLVLRHFSSGDLEALHEILGHPEVMRFSLRGPLSREETSNWLAKRLADSEAGRPTQYAVTSRKDSRLIGFSGYVPYDDTESEAEYEIGYRFHPSSWGQGIGTEAVLATLNYGFSTLGFREIIAFVERENKASVRILEKIGMRFDKDTLYHDIPVMKYIITR